jgi:hypothetical protein
MVAAVLQIFVQSSALVESWGPRMNPSTSSCCFGYGIWEIPEPANYDQEMLE